MLNQKVKDRELEKLYLCVTVGIPKEKSARLTAYHQKDENTKTVKVSDKKFEGSRHQGEDDQCEQGAPLSDASCL